MIFWHNCACWTELSERILARMLFGDAKERGEVNVDEKQSS